MFEGKAYPSVTTVIGKSMKEEGLRAWREWIGCEEADKITTQACNRGTAFHRIAEKYLLSQDYKTGEMPVNLYDFEGVKPHLERVTKIYGCEYPLGSHRIKTAGTADCICEFDGETTILDFKTSRKSKKEEYLFGYFIQATTYAMMVEEIYQMSVPRLAIIMMVNHEPVEVYSRPNEAYREEVWKIFNLKNYRRIWGQYLERKDHA